MSIDLAASNSHQAAQLKRIQTNSWFSFQSLMLGGWPIKFMPIFITEEAREKSGLNLFQALPEIFKIHFHQKLPIKNVNQAGYEVDTLLIDTPLYLEKLSGILKAQRVEFVEKTFSHISEVVLEVGPSTLIFNCTGLGAKNLADDANVLPVRGDLVYIKAHPGFDPSKIGYMLFMARKELIICFLGRVRSW